MTIWCAQHRSNYALPARACSPMPCPQALLMGLIEPPDSSLVEGGKVPKPIKSKDAAADVHVKEGAGDAPSPEGEGSEEGGDAAAAAAAPKKGKKSKAKEEPMKLFGAIIPGMRGATLFKWMDAISGNAMCVSLCPQPSRAHSLASLVCVMHLSNVTWNDVLFGSAGSSRTRSAS